MTDFISSEYRLMQEILHAAPQGYGGKGRKWADTVLALMSIYEAESILDYGCGQGSLAKTLGAQGVSIREYDPAIPKKAILPGQSDLVVCTDVLEHIEPERLTDVLDHLRWLTKKAALIVVALDPSNKTLTNGRNAHLIQESAEWWHERIVAAKFRVCRIPDLPEPVAYTNPVKRAKRWVAVVEPC